MSRALSLLRLLLIALVYVFPMGAVAQGTPPDLIRLTNGGVVRATIVENIPGDHLVVQLANGELRTFPAAEIESVAVGAGAPEPAERPTTPTAAAAPDQAAEADVHVHVTSTVLDASLFHVTELEVSSRGTQTNHFALLCRAPCDLTLRPGSYVFGLAEGATPSVVNEDPWTISDGTHLEIFLQDRSDLRVVGGVLLGSGAVAGGIVGAAGFFAASTNEGRVLGLLVGAGVLVVFAVPAFMLLGLRDIPDLRRLQEGVRF